MKNSWKRIAARIDALSLRERAFLFLSIVAVCLALADQLWTAPAQAAYQQLKQKIASDNVELQRLREELKANPPQPDPARAGQDELLQLKAGIAAAERDIAALGVSSDPALTLPDAMVHLLRRYAGLTLVRVSSPTTDVPRGASLVASDASSAAPRRGLELTVSGPYAELVRYLQTLESALPALRWGTLKLAAAQQPPELTVQVFLVVPRR